MALDLQHKKETMLETQLVDNEKPIDRQDLEALKDWIKAEFKVVDANLEAMKDAIRVAARERDKKDIELNDVRLRFVPREVYEADLRALRDESERRESRIRSLENWKSRAAGMVIVMTLFAGSVGAAIMKLILKG